VLWCPAYPSKVTTAERGSGARRATRDHGSRCRCPRSYPSGSFRKSGSQETRCWRKGDSNLYGAFPVKSVVLGSLFRSGKGRSSFFNRAVRDKRVCPLSTTLGHHVARGCFFVRLRAVSSSRPEVMDGAARRGGQEWRQGRRQARSGLDGRAHGARLDLGSTFAFQRLY
jgi:hypothetical protein